MPTLSATCPADRPHDHAQQLIVTDKGSVTGSSWMDSANRRTRQVSNISIGGSGPRSTSTKVPSRSVMRQPISCTS